MTYSQSCDHMTHRCVIVKHFTCGKEKKMNVHVNVHPGLSAQSAFTDTRFIAIMYLTLFIYAKKKKLSKLVELPRNALHGVSYIHFKFKH